MTKVSKLFNGQVSFLKSYNGYNMIVNLTKLSKVIIYFNKNGLKTKKYINYFNWLKVYNLVIKKEHFNKEGLNKLKNLVSKINKNDIHNI